MEDSHNNIESNEKINKLEKLIYEINDSLDYWVDNYHLLSPSEQTLICRNKQ